MEAYIVNEPLIDLVEEVKAVEDLAKKDKKYESLIQLSDIMFMEQTVAIRVNNFANKAHSNDYLVDCYYDRNHQLIVMSVDLVEKKIRDRLILDSSSWDFGTGPTEYFGD